jgi:hypothetical protein
MPSARAIIKKSKRKNDWKSARQEWPHQGVIVDIICTTITKGYLTATKPHRVWQQANADDKIFEVKFWKETDDDTDFKQY